MELDREAAAALGIPGDVVARAAARRREGRTLGEALAELGATDAATFGRALAEAAGLPFAPAPPALPARELTAVLPMPFARRHLVLPLARDAAGLAVALADPAALAALDDLRLLYRAPLRPLVVPAPALRDAITRAYDATARSAADTMDALEGERLDLVASELDGRADPRGGRRARHRRARVDRADRLRRARGAPPARPRERAPGSHRPGARTGYRARARAPARPESRHHPGDRPDRERQDDDPLRRAPPARHRRAQHHDHRGPDRVPAARDRADPGQQPNRPHLRGRAARRAAPGPRRDPGRRDPRPRDGRDRHAGGPHRAPGLLHAAYQ